MDVTSIDGDIGRAERDIKGRIYVELGGKSLQIVICKFFQIYSIYKLIVRKLFFCLKKCVRLRIFAID